jgi:hypothetical protein
LIEVPALLESLEDRGWKRVRSRRPSNLRRSRRRLRREVRTAGYGIVLIAILASVAPTVRGLASLIRPHPEREAVIDARRAAQGVAGLRPTISISIEPAALAPYAEVESPVAFPGYLLPDEGYEEPAHAGS